MLTVRGRLAARPRLSVALLLGLVAGCLEEPGPRATTPGAEFPLQVQSEAQARRLVSLTVSDMLGGSTILRARYDVPPGSWAQVEPVRLPYASYELRAESGDLARHVVAEFRPGDAFHRFVVLDDVIAYQRG